MPGVPVVPLPNSISLSAITVFVVFAVVVVPFTVRLPVITAFLVTAKSLPIVTSSGCEIVTVPELSVTAISFDVPEIVNVPPNATALVLEPSEIVIELFVNDELPIFDNVLFEALIVLLVNVSVFAINDIVPVASGIVTVLSEVGSATVKVVSCASAVSPSNTMLLSSVIVVKLPGLAPPVTSVKNASVPLPFCSVIVLSAVGSVTCKVVSYASSVVLQIQLHHL